MGSRTGVRNPRTPGVAGSQYSGRSSALVLVAGSGDRLAGEVVAGELDGSLAPVFSADVADAVVASFLDEQGRLVPGRVDAGDVGGVSGEVAQRRRERARRLDEMRAAALAPGTLSGYGLHVKAWREWARAEQVAPLPLDPRHVADFLMDYALEWDFETGEYARDVEGRLVPAVSMNTVGARLAALNKLAEFAGIARPGDNAGVKQVMSGLRRTFGTHVQGRAALDLSLVNKLLDAAGGGGFVPLRDRAAALLRARTGASAGQLVRLRWSDVVFTGQGVEVTLAKTSRYGSPAVVRVAAHRNDRVCVVSALTALRRVAPSLGLVFTRPDGKALSRQGVHASVGAGAWEELPAGDDRHLARMLDSNAPGAVLRDTRDRALVLTGFYTALRRSNLSMLNWGDVHDQGDDGLSVLVRRSKTDQEGKGRVVWVPQAGESGQVVCPATALRLWRRELESRLGRAVADDEPVFTSLASTGDSVLFARSGAVRRLSGGAVNAVVQRLASAAGLTEALTGGSYGAHSLRAGFVTEAVRGDKLSILEVMEVTGHQSADMVARYRREVNAAQNNGARKLLGALGKL